jgi:fumigallin biosynthesis monooxygenase-like protein
MAKVVPGYVTAELEGDFVVFLIGMRINKLWKLHKWLPVAAAMGPMLRELMQNRDLGLLHFTTWLGPRGPMVVQYWRSVEQLEAFAKNPDLTHRPAWKRWNKAVGTSGDVGIWHESFVVRDGTFEVLYGNMPTSGLAAAGSPIPVSHGTRTAASRRATNAA